MTPRTTQRAALALLFSAAASQAFAQSSGGLTAPNVTGVIDPVDMAIAITVIVLAIGGVACIAAWAKVALGFFGRAAVSPGYVWGVGTGTVILGACGWIATRVFT